MTDLDRFLDDVAAIPGALDALAADPPAWRPDPNGRTLLVGMGSSHFAAATVARRWRRAGLLAVAEVASTEASWPPAADLTVVAISASGRSAETLAAVEPYVGTARVVAITNEPGSPLAAAADEVVELCAGHERSGVSCRSYHQTLAVLLGDAPVRRAAEAAADLFDRRGEWLGPVAEALDGGAGTWFIAPAERWCSAEQSALMVREVPRRLADACETGDWSHVDVYLTKTCDYRAVVFCGSRWAPAAAGWLTRRAATVVAIGGTFDGATTMVRYRHDDDPDVALVVEVVVAELLAEWWWRRDG